MTRLVWCTDTHFNFIGDAETFYFGRSLSDGADACLITGDIAESGSLRELLNAFQYGFKKPVYFVLGNHDFYGGSIDYNQTMAVPSLCKDNPNLHWLGGRGVFQIGGSELCGVDGWYDGQLGDRDSRLEMTDFSAIEELRRAAARGRDSLLNVLARLGQESAAAAQETLARTEGKRVLFATHVPPYEGATWHEGKISGPGWVPFMSNKALGFALSQFATARPDVNLTTLCGHTHSPGRYLPQPNHVVLTGAAAYGRPSVCRTFEL